jgi:hypothetical protein
MLHISPVRFARVVSLIARVGVNRKKNTTV